MKWYVKSHHRDDDRDGEFRETGRILPPDIADYLS